MKAKKHFSLFILLLIGSNIFAMSWNREEFLIRNYTNNDVVINIEFQEGIRGNPESLYGWEQTICGIGVIITDALSLIHSNIVKPSANLGIIHYTPFPPSPANYERLYNLPFMTKIKAIFKKLDIIYNGGRNVITLNNLGDRIIKRGLLVGGQPYYVLEIFEDDLEGKPASEW